MKNTVARHAGRQVMGGRVGTFLLECEQWIPRPIDKVFALFAEATNLEALTPSWLGFRILSPEPVTMRAGALILYRLRWRWFPLRWITEIQEWEPPFRFVDVQRRGPYALWHHTHSFESHEGGTAAGRMQASQSRAAAPVSGRDERDTTGPDQSSPLADAPGGDA